MNFIDPLTLQALKARLTRRLLGPRVLAVVVDSKSGLYAVDPEDQGVGRRLRRSGDYGRPELDQLAPHLSADSRVLVVGAHIGTLAVPLALRCAEVVAIEANPTTFRLLQMNVLLNAATRCRPLNIAASDRDEPLRFLLNRANSGGSKRVPAVRQQMYYYDQPEEITVPAHRLDEHLPGERFDVVVMDIEGSETFALRGMQRILAGCRALLVEFTPHHLRDVAGVSVAQFLEPLQPHFDTLTVPTQGVTVDAPQFLSKLSSMYERNEEDEGIMFTARR